MSLVDSSSHYRVLARKYRPNFFREVVGQQPFVGMIQNAISQPKVPGGIMLTGTRGVGKTTLARLVAKTLTCQNLDHQRMNPPLEPCGTCSSCQSCSLDTHLDIQEIDAASHTGVDDIRVLLESCRYRSLSGASYRVYIIDEVHMLSKSAFNSLLKTLEEPPSHVSFIFATTEIHKIPKTILSRCQQFYLRRVEDTELKRYLADICVKEDIVAEDAVFELLVKHAGGSVRDAFSLLERAILLSGRTLIESAVRKMLGLPEQAQVYHALFLLGTQNISELLNHVRQLYYSGIDPKRFLEQMAQGLYHIVLDFFSANAEPNIWTPLQEYFNISSVTALWQCIINGFDELEKSNFPLISLEMLLMRMAHMQSLPNLESVLEAWGSDARKLLAAPATQRDILPIQNPELNTVYDFRQFLAFLEQEKEDLLHAQLVKQTNFSKVEAGVLYLYWIHDAPPESEWMKRLTERLRSWTGRSIAVRIEASQPAAPMITWEAQEHAHQVQQAEQLLKHPLVQKMQSTFPGLKFD
jgi:DNA polymerase-3 subunit gamma/tau